MLTPWIPNITLSASNIFTMKCVKFSFPLLLLFFFITVLSDHSMEWPLFEIRFFSFHKRQLKVQNNNKYWNNSPSIDFDITKKILILHQQPFSPLIAKWQRNNNHKKAQRSLCVLGCSKWISSVYVCVCVYVGIRKYVLELCNKFTVKPMPQI